MKHALPLHILNPMRYLVVPSQDTEAWKEYLITNEWLERGYNIQIEKNERAIPLSNLFPDELPTELKKFRLIEKNVPIPAPNDYLGYLKQKIGEEIFEKFKKYWPQSFDQIGEIIIIKIPTEIEKFSHDIGSALLNQNPKMSRVFHDLGVQGEFRVRKLELISGNKDLGGETKIKENGGEFIIDISKGYFSPRLATERFETLNSAKLLKNKLGRSLKICDAYAGFGPALVTLLNEKGLVNYILANDLNPEVTKILNQNLINCSKENVQFEVQCIDARKLVKFSKNKGNYDLLLVNLPHSTLEHLPQLIGLLNENNPSLLRAWCIIQSNEIEEVKNKLFELFTNLKKSITKISVNPTRSYSPTQIYAKIEVWLN